jgi:hypothetical protein
MVEGTNGLLDGGMSVCSVGIDEVNIAQLKTL